MKPTLYLFIGYPGAGKTTTAKLIADKTGAVHLWADVERHKMFANPTHSEEESLKLYDALNLRASELLKQGKDVVYDTNFNFYADRVKMADIATQNNARTVLIWITTPAEVARQRAVSTEKIRNNYQVLMTDEQFDSIASKLEPPTENEKVIKIDGTALDPEAALDLLNL